MSSAGCFKSSPFLNFVFGVVAFLLVIFTGSSCNAEKVEVVTATALANPIDCRPYHLRSMKLMLKSFGKCSRELKANTTKNGTFNDKEYEENIGCAMKCTMRAMTYSENDVVTLDSMRASVAKLVPELLIHPVVKMLLSRCHEKYGNKLDPEEARCRAYSEYAFCIQNCIADMVDSEFCIKYDKNNKPIVTTPTQ